MKSSYREEDVTLLVKDLTGLVTPVSLEEKDKRVANGEYDRSIMIEEYPMSTEYRNIALNYMPDFIKQTSIAVGNVAEQIYAEKGKDLVLVSMLRAGTPIGILIKKYLNRKYNIDVPHYSVSIVERLDNNAMKYILSKHKAECIQFIDGWTGKGSVVRKLVESAKEYEGVDSSLAVLSDSIGIAKYSGVKKDIYIPSAPLNATVTGLVSIAVYNNELVKDTDFHGAMYLENLESIDYSQKFIDLVSEEFEDCDNNYEEVEEVNEVKRVADELNVSLNLLNPSINEAARALLRRNLDKLLVSDVNDKDVKCIIELAKLKNVPIVEYNLKYYKAISVAKY